MKQLIQNQDSKAGKYLLLLLCFIAVTSIEAMAQYPIPSFNVLVSGKACFQEYTTGDDQIPNIVRGKRMIKVQSSCSGLFITTCEAKVWVYSLDGQTTLGPFTLGCNETLSVEIDERDWGVIVETDCDMLISVWIEETDLPVKNTSFLMPVKS